MYMIALFFFPSMELMDLVWEQITVPKRNTTDECVWSIAGCPILQHGRQLDMQHFKQATIHYLADGFQCRCFSGW